jgi:predicted NAD/FAD-dependent oxidoreductase
VSFGGDVVAPGSAETAYAFDHGCQFFRADTSRFREQILSRWVQEGVAAAWRPKVLATAPKAQFFGVPTNDNEVFCGVGGMHNLVAAPVRNAIAKHPESVTLRSATRVASVERKGEQWELLGVAGHAALHDTPEAEAQEHGPLSLGCFDAVLFTDVSMSAESWHRASAGLPADFIKEALPDLEKRPRVCLFTAMVAFDGPLLFSSADDETGAIALDDETLWWAARTNSKPGQEDLARECWTLVSTPSYAAAEVKKVKQHAILPTLRSISDISILCQYYSCCLR